DRFRFAPEERRWRACMHDRLARRLAEVPFVVVDLETTGGAATGSGITEIGAVRVLGGRLAESFVTLVNPGRPIPAFVSQLTGISDAMVAGAPPLADALPRFLRFLGDGILVAHNAAFDVGHLDAAHLAYAGRPLGFPSLCTLR